MMKIFMMMMTAFLVVVAASISSAAFRPECDRHVPELARHSGSYRLPHSNTARMFYFFFNSRARKTDPVVLWLAGGPGCGGATSALNNNGPFQLLPNMSLLRNPYGWDKVSNLLYVDQPIGTGFTLSPDDNDLRHDEKSITKDLYDFLKAFYRDHPRYVNNRFYIAGESYSGHYIPALASRIQRNNREQKGIFINLKGIAIGNGWTNPLVQYRSFVDYSLLMKLISRAEYERIRSTLVPQCEDFLGKCVSKGGNACGLADDVCEGIMHNITRISGVMETDIRKKRSRGTESIVGKFMNQTCVKDALGVGRHVNYTACNSQVVFGPLTRDFFTNLDTGVPAILEDGVEVLVYVGASDLVCNWIGNERWVEAMKWSGATRFKESPTRPFMVNGAKAGEYVSYGPLGFMKVFEAGHNVPTKPAKSSIANA